MRALQTVDLTPEQLPLLADVGQGIRVIRGAAGSGKTTVALLRLRQLCQSRITRRMRLASAEPVRVLVLTFNRTLRGYIQELANDVDAIDEVAVTVDTFGHWAHNLVGEPRVIPDEGRKYIASLLTDLGVTSANLDYFVDEIKYIQGRFPPNERNRYLETTRIGRGRTPQVSQPLRERLLEEVVSRYEEYKRKQALLDWNDVALAAAETADGVYDVVIVDETQDLSSNQMRAILAHLDPNHVTTFVIDAAQRIYPQGFQWSELGVSVRPEMVYTLHTNYRNTKQIARLAASLLVGLPADADGVAPDETSCERTGPLPKVIVGKYGAQLSHMLEQIDDAIVAGETVAILHAKGGGWFSSTEAALRARGIEYCSISRAYEWPAGPELVALSTIHSAKGLEFDHVFMPGLSDEVTPHGEGEGDGTLDALRRLVAMGVGRARKTVTMGYKKGEMSSVFEWIDPSTYEMREVPE